MTATVAFRHRLRALRKRKGPYRSSSVAEAETARLLAMLPAGSMERAIFELCEIAGKPYKVIAAQLGISERHLYRIRVALFECLAASERGAEVVPVIPPAVQRLDFARSLLKYGHAKQGEAVAREVLAQTMPALHAVEALTVCAIACCDQERYGEADQLLEEARRQAASLDEVDVRSARRAITMAQAYAPYRDGLADVAIATSESALHSAADPQNPHDIRSLARDLIFLGIQHEEAGSPRRGLECLGKALALVKRLPNPPAAELAQIYIHSAFGRAALQDESPQALYDAQEGLRIAQWHGLQFEEIWANIAVAIMLDMAGKPHEGLEPVHRALQSALTAFEGDPLIRTLFVTARIEGAAGLGEQALSRLATARPIAQNHGLLRGILEVAEARARRHRGETEATIAAATRAISALEGRALTHYLGIPYLARALARTESGASPVDDVERAVYYLERGGALADEATALELSFRLTRRREDMERARELREMAARIA